MIYLLILAVAYILHQHQIAKTAKELYNEDVTSLQVYIETELFNRSANPFGIVSSQEMTDEDIECLFEVVEKKEKSKDESSKSLEIGEPGHQRPQKVRQL